MDMNKTRIIDVYKWGAKPPRQGKENLQVVGKASRIIFHHTAGHHTEIDDPSDYSVGEAIRYARDIQDFHMRPVSKGGRGWLDSGHNFLVCRNGVILQGRWLTISTIRAQMMVRSAHCPGQNDQIGIEHEHQGDEPMTKKQLEAAAMLQAWIAYRYGRTTALPVFPHSKYYNTTCPSNLISDIKAIKARANEILSAQTT